MPDKEGRRRRTIVLKCMEATGIDLKAFAVSGGDPSQFWAQGRMKGFREAIQEAIPDATFVDDRDRRPQHHLRPGQDLRRLQGVPVGRPEVEFIENVDIGADYADKAIVGRAARARPSPSAGTSAGAARGHRQRRPGRPLDQKWPEQAGFGALACADFLANGVVRPNTQTLRPVPKEDVAQARTELEKILSSDEKPLRSPSPP